MSGNVIHLSYPLALLAGLVSFLSPCVFPLLPAYLAYLGGQAGEGTVAVPAAEDGRPGPRPGPGAAPAAVLGSPPRGAVLAVRVPLMANGVAFVVGFSAVFITLYYVLRALDVLVLVEHRRTLEIVAGAIVVVLGLQTLGLVRVGLLMREARLPAPVGATGVVGAFLLGVTFAAGWTPCIGPQLGAILTVAQQNDFTGLPVMVAYCLGLAVPFLVAAAAADRLQGLIRRLNRRLGVVNLVAGVLLLVFGVLLIAGSLTSLNRFGAPVDL